MASLFIVLEYLITAPGRLIVWLRWALPSSWRYHDDHYRDHRLAHWIASIGFYVGAWTLVAMMLENGALQSFAATVAQAFASR